ncbi:AIM24 family protein [Romboutsia sp.]|uniref:AIM24 family protein n=1 Tax=Romboutsia sp. TaxID=1965302 RepID=UPI002C4B5496|nr:AIM24 family protein [Romboutsia sp.]HSQ90096.1 AIM24 family protein [Romboutsia sp.]
MKTLEEKITIIDRISYDDVDFEVIAYNNLEGAQNVQTAMGLFFANQAGLKMKQVRIRLNNSSVKTEAGALYYYKGNIQSKSNIGGVGGLFKKAISGAITNESAIKPTYIGTGEILLEPSYKHYIMMELSKESIIVDKGMFYCCSEDIRIKGVAQKNISATLLGGEGIFQIELSGTGIVVLECNVPKEELIECDITPGEELKVDGNFAIARTKGVNFSVTKSDKSLFGSAINGEGLLNTFTGCGKVWIAPTQPMYEKMNYGLPTHNNSMNNTSPRQKG